MAVVCHTVSGDDEKPGMRSEDDDDDDDLSSVLKNGTLVRNITATSTQLSSPDLHCSCSTG